MLEVQKTRVYSPLTKTFTLKGKEEYTHASKRINSIKSNRFISFFHEKVYDTLN